MLNCPQCKASNDDRVLKCVRCGCALTVSDDACQTIDLSQVSLGADSDVQATLDIDVRPSTSSNSFAVDMTIDVSDTDTTNRATANVASDGGDYSIDFGSDDESILMQDDDSKVPIHEAQTLLVGTYGSEPKTIDGKRANTAGQLEDIWKGAVGASMNPMHSLSAAGLQASDSIFERVAVRKVLDLKAKESADADYRIVDKLGEGGMGVVFTARQTAIDRLVAIKVAKPKFQKSPDARKRFLYEAQITADLDHSNIVPIHELGVTGDGTLFYSMKIVDGDQWSQVIGEKSREQNLDIFMKVADAVAFAHSKGIIHRDLKPENTMLGRFGEVFVTDWGTAVNLNKDSTLVVEPPRGGAGRLKVQTSENFRMGEAIVITNDIEVLERNEVVQSNDGDITLARPLQRDYAIDNNLRIVKAFNLAGTPCYMAPEMAGHQINKIGSASDIYILGAILFDMVTGRPPHSGPTVTHCLMNALGNELVIPDDAEDDALLSIALKAMSSEPSDRYESVEQMQEAVRQYRRHAESLALTDRSSTLLVEAKETGDYQTFSRAVFGFRDAIDLWPENAGASEGLLASRLAFAEAAFAKGDYDLVVQTVDGSVPVESELRKKAELAKQRRMERESRIKLLQRLVATVVSIAIVGLSALSYYAINEQRKAVASALAENEAKLEAQEEKAKADAARNVAVDAQAKEVEQRKIAERREIEAEERRKQAVQAQQAELLAKQDAQRKAIQIQLDDYKSSIALANSRLASFDVRSSREILEQLPQKGNNISKVAPPAFKTWGWQRLRLLGNADLPQTTIAGRVIASSAAPSANLVAVSTDTGEILVYSLAKGHLTLVHSHREPGSVVGSIVISEDGSRLAYTYSNSDSSGIRYWNLGKEEPVTIRSSVGKNFQSILLTRDGRYLVSGISAGLWVWDLSKEGWIEEDFATRRLNNVRGRSISVQEISDMIFLLTVDFNKQRELRLVDVMQETNELVALPESIRDNLVCGLPLKDGQIALGLKDNRIAIAQFDKKQLIVDTFLEPKHASTVTKIIQGQSGRLISMSDSEPVAQVWRKVNGRWQHESFLAGLRDNLVDVQCSSDGAVVGIDTSSSALSVPRESRAIVWNVDRQVQRLRMERPIENSNASRYPESVEHIVAGGYNSIALTVDVNGCINTWNLLDGRTSDPVFSYIGHTPGAELVDSVSHVDSNVLVTVAKLRDAERAYLSDRGATWEFCLWDLSSRQMIRRWTKTDQPSPGQTEPTSIEPRLTLLDRGAKLLTGSDTHTSIIDIKSGEELLHRDDWGSYFAIENPKDNSQVLLIKRTGAIRLLNLKTWGWNEGKLDDVSLILASDSPPMQAVWAPSGEHFYIAYANGEMAKVKIVDRTASILWHSKMLGKEPTFATNSLQLKSGEVRLQSDLDLMLTNDGGREIVQTAIRTGSNDRLTRHVELHFDAEAIKPKSIQVSGEPLRGNYWLIRNELGEVVLTEKLHKTFAIDRSRVRVMQQRASSILVSSKSAQTYVVDRESDVATRVGRLPVLSVAGKPDGSIMYCLHDDGSLSSYEPKESQDQVIKKLGYALPNARKIGLSTDARYLATILAGDLRVIDPVSGQVHKDLGKAVQFVWNPLAESELASCSEDGTATIFDSTFQIVRKVNLALQSGESIVGLHLFNETFDAPNVPSRRHLLIHTRDAESDYVNIASIDATPSILTESKESNLEPGLGEIVRQRLIKNSLVAASPTEGLFATGTDNGTVNVWYCSPTWGGPRELFDLVGHRGAKVTAIAFTSDGCTLLTADDNKRLFAWVSKDPQAQ